MIPWIAIILAGLALALVGIGRRSGFYVFAASNALWSWNMGTSGAETPMIAYGVLAALSTFIGLSVKWAEKTK